MNTNVCVMCGRCKDLVGHLFFTCPFAKNIWNLCDNWKDIATTLHNLEKKSFLSFFSTKVK